MATLIVTNTNNRGTGSLRAAIASANDGDTIRFSPTLANRTIRLERQLVIDKNLTIDGSDARNLTLSGENQTRILHITYDYSDVVLRNLTFANGRAVDDDPDTALQGGAIEVRDSNTLVVENSRFINNRGERGGAIFVSYGSTATIKDSVFDGNDGTSTDGFSAGAISTFGGGTGAQVVNSNGVRDVGGGAFLDISGSTFTNNKGTYGAVYTLLTDLKVEDSVFRNNEALREGGAIFTDGANGTEQADDIGGTTIIRNVVAEGNKGGAVYGGAFYFFGYSKDRYIIENSRITNNTARRGAGIAVQSARDAEPGDGVRLIIRDSIIDNNTGSSQGGGLWADVKGGVTIEGSTFANNQVTSSGSVPLGGAIVLNTPEEIQSTITDTTFINNTASAQAGSIWIRSRTAAQNLTIRDSQFANNRSGNNQLENTVNFPAINGGGNTVQNTDGIDDGLEDAELVDVLEIDPLPAIPADPTPTPRPEPTPPRPEPEPDPSPQPEPEPEPTPDPSPQPEPEPEPTPEPEPVPEPTPIISEPVPAPIPTPTDSARFTLGLNLVQGNTNSVNELLVVETDDATGQIDGIAPGAAGYDEALLEYAVVVFSTLKTGQLPEVMANRTLMFAKDSHLQFAMLENGSLDSRRRGGAGVLKLVYPVENRLPIAANTLQAGGLKLNLQAEGAPGDATPIELQTVHQATAPLGSSLQGYITDSELLDFRNESGVRTVTFEVSRSAGYNNLVGFYRVENEQGQIFDDFGNLLNPGDDGYREAALNNRLTDVNLTGRNGRTETFTAAIEMGQLLSSFIVVDGSTEQLTDTIASNDPSIYFTHIGANADGVDHVRLLGDNTFGFEDLSGGGDLDYNDLVVKTVVT